MRNLSYAFNRFLCLFLMIASMHLFAYIDTIKTITISIPEEPIIGSKIGNLQSHMTRSLLAIQNQLVFIKMKTVNSDYVNIDSNSGEITVNKRIDKEQICPKKSKCKIKVIIHCNNRGNFVELLELIIEIVDINDNTCSFVNSNKQKITWPEDSRKYDTKESLNRPQDLDTSFSIQRSDIKLIDSYNLFKLEIQEISSLIRPFNLELMLIGDLDYETKQEYHVTVEAGDGNSKCRLNIIVQVNDINDNSPTFSSKSYQILIQEDAPVNKSFFQVKADDKDSGENAHIVYEIDSYADRDIKNKFGITINGQLYLKVKLNYHDSASYKIPIIARNANMHARFGTTQIVVTVTDVNNNSPEISINSAYTGTSNVSIEEEKIPGMDVGMMIVSDKDAGMNARVSCAISKQSFANAMELRGTNSNKQYRLVTNRKIDREQVSSLAITILCHDYGVPQRTAAKLLVVTVLDINDNAPKFHAEHINIKIREDSDPERRRNNYIIYKFTAVDRDFGRNKQILYSIRYSNGPMIDNFLKMDANTGILSSNGNLDRELTANLSFIVIAKDKGEPPLTGSMNVNIIVLDYNDEHPEFSIDHGYSFLINENNKPEVCVGRFFARDKDEDRNALLNFKVETGETHFPFKIYAKKLNDEEKKRLNQLDYDWSIEIFALESIDRESLRNFVSKDNVGFEFLVRAQDSGLPQLAKRVKVRIIVVDENDNRPHFTFPNMNNSQLTVSYRQKKGFRIGKITAMDSDFGINGTVEYTISDDRSSPDIGSIFSVDSSNGYLTLARSLTSSDIQSIPYRVVVVASDRAIPLQTRLSTTQTLEMVINDSDIDLRTAYRDDKSNDDDDSHFGTIFTGGNSSAEQAINLYIIVAIIVGSFVISVIMLAAICVVLKKSRRHQATTRLSYKDSLKDSVHESSSAAAALSLSVSASAATAATTPAFSRGNKEGLRQSESLLALSANICHYQPQTPLQPHPQLFCATHNHPTTSMDGSESNSYICSSNSINNIATTVLAPVVPSSTAALGEERGVGSGYSFFRTLSTDQISPSKGSRSPIITPFIPPNLLPQHEEELHCSNTSTDLDSGKGDSVEVSGVLSQQQQLTNSGSTNPVFYHNRHLQSSQMCDSITGSSTINNPTMLDFPITLSASANPHYHPYHHHHIQNDQITALRICPTLPSQNISSPKNIIGYYRTPRFFHMSYEEENEATGNYLNNSSNNNNNMSNSNRGSAEFVVSNDDQYSTSYI